MRWLPLILGLCLLFPTLSYAQNRPMIITQSELSGDTYALYRGDNTDLLKGRFWHEVFASPDGQKAAFLGYPLFAREGREVEPGIYPVDLFVVDFAAQQVIPLAVHGDTEPDTLIFSGSDRGIGVEASGAWDEPETWLFGSRYNADVVWSPDSRYIAYLQSVVQDHKYGEPMTRLVVFDVATGEEQIIAEYNNGLSEDKTGYAVLWLDSGIVLLSQPPESSLHVQLFSAEGEVLSSQEIEAVLSNENPVRYEGRDYLHFANGNIYDVSTGTLEYYAEGTVGLVSPSSDNSLVLEACSNSETLKTTWDVYTPDGEKVLNTDGPRPALSADGQQMIYQTFAGDTMLFNGTESIPYTDALANEFASRAPVWGAVRHVISSVGAEECHRSPVG